MRFREWPFSRETSWLGLSVALFLLIQALTYWTVTTDSDDPILARLSTPVSLIKPDCLSGANDRPIDRRPECRVPGPFDSMTGSGCRWWVTYPMFSCRLGEVPVSLLLRPRYGGIQELPVTLLTRALGPIAATKIAAAVTRLGLIFVLFFMLRQFRLPPQALPLLVITPLFQGLGHHCLSSVFFAFLLYLTFLLLVSPGSRRFFAGITALLFGTYMFMATAVGIVPGIAVLYFSRKGSRRALQASLAAGAGIFAWFAVSLLRPDLRSELSYDLMDPTVWRKSLEQYGNFLKSVYGVLSLSGDLNYYPVPPAPVWARVLGFGVFSMPVLSGFVLKGKQSKTIRALLALFVLSSLLFFSVGHYFVGRILVYVPIALLASYLSAESLRAWLRKKGVGRWFHLPVVWLWATALLSSGFWIYSFNPSTVPLGLNADYFAKLGRHLSERGVRAPFLANGLIEMGMLDVFSGEQVRPVYLNSVWLLPRTTDPDPIEGVLAPWSRLSGGTFLVKTPDELEGTSVPIGLQDLSAFAKRHSIEIKRAELFTYRGDEGYWIIDFASRRW